MDSLCDVLPPNRRKDFEFSNHASQALGNGCRHADVPMFSHELYQTGIVVRALPGCASRSWGEPLPHASDSRAAGRSDQARFGVQFRFRYQRDLALRDSEELAEGNSIRENPGLYFPHCNMKYQIWMKPFPHPIFPQFGWACIPVQICDNDERSATRCIVPPPHVLAQIGVSSEPIGPTNKISSMNMSQ